MNKEKLGKTKPIGCAFTAGSDPTSMLFSIHVPEHKNSRVRDMESVSQGVNVCTGSPRKVNFQTYHLKYKAPKLFYIYK